MRKYQPIWEQIKETHTASLSANPIVHKRIIKAVTKEKLNDLGWKLMCKELGNTYRLLHTSEGALITFKLEIDKSIRNL